MVVQIPLIEIHPSNVHAREPFRHHSYLSDKAKAVICGLVAYGYVAALDWWVWKFNDGPRQGSRWRAGNEDVGTRKGVCDDPRDTRYALVRKCIRRIIEFI